MEKKTLSHACMQLGRDRVCCLYKGSVELPSDMHGIVYIPFKDSV
jgi:predicted nucleotide-binding protein